MKRNKDNKGNYIEGIDEKFQDLAAGFSKLDFSKESNKAYVFETTLKNVNSKGDKDMNKIRKTVAIAASLVLASTLVAQTSFAQESVSKIIKSINLGHVTMVQEEDNDEPKEVDLPDSLKGKAYDKNGKLIEKLTKDTAKDGIYDKDGNRITKFIMNDGSVVGMKDKNSKSEDKLYVTDINKISDYTCFKVKLPTYLPDGYTFKNAEFTKDENGNVKDSKYADINFENKVTGKEIFLQERFACDETKTVGNADDIEKIKINGVDAILSDGRNIDWETDNTLFYLGGKNIGKDEVIKVAESIK
jgi:hypothetical protein